MQALTGHCSARPCCRREAHRAQLQEEQPQQELQHQLQACLFLRGTAWTGEAPLSSTARGAALPLVWGFQMALQVLHRPHPLLRLLPSS